MRVLVGWDDPADAESISLMLNIDGNEAEIVTDGSEYEQAAAEGDWDVLVQALSFPSRSTSLEVFDRVEGRNGNVPVIGVWRQDEITELAKFVSHGLHSHLMRDSDGSFLLLLTSMIDAAKSAIHAQQAALLSERLRQEVDSVRRLQESVIPRDLIRPSGYNLAPRYESSEIHVSGIVPVAMAGGDCYDVFRLDDDKLVLLVGDASGHGVKACMSIMTMHSMIRMIESSKFSTTAEFVTEVNRRMCANDIVQDEGGFITLLYSVLDLKRNCLQWTSAGSPMPLLQDLGTNEVKPLGYEDEAGLPLAIEGDWEYECFEFEMPKNSRLLVYTDGLEEAFPVSDSGHDQFGIAGIVSSLQSSSILPLEVALEKLFSDSMQYTRGEGRADDTSVLLIERLA